MAEKKTIELEVKSNVGESIADLKALKRQLKDTAAGSEASASPAPVGGGAGAISGSQQFNPLMNPNLVPPVNSMPNPKEATPI